MNKELDDIAAGLSRAGIASPRLEARLLLGKACGVSADEAVLIRRELTSEERARLCIMLKQRLEHKPLDKILGYKGFYKYDFIVDENVLSPRPDTEIIVEEALKLLNEDITQNIVDLGTGSGCILLSLLAENSLWRGQGVDKSPAALKVASKNSALLKVEKQVSWVNGSWFDEDLIQCLKTPVDMLISNPPYIPSADICGLETDVKDYDPLSALDGGTDGLTHYRQIAVIAPKLLRDGGFVVLEVGIGQARTVSEIFSTRGLSPVCIVADLAGIDRCVILKK